MALRISTVQRSVETTPRSDAGGDAPRRVSLFTESTFETSSVTFGDGTRLGLPRLSGDERAKIDGVLASVPVEHRARVEGSTRVFVDALYGNGAAGSGVGGTTQSLRDAAEGSLRDYMAATGVTDQEGATTGALFLAMAGIEQDLGVFAKGVADKLQLGRDLRTDVTELREALADWPEGVQTQRFSWNEIVIDEHGNTKVVQHTDEALTKEQAQALMEKLEGQLQSLRDMSEMDRFDLQRKTEDYQQALNTLSSILKMMHETHKSIIGNLRS